MASVCMDSTLDPNVICRACTYKDSAGKFAKPKWTEHPQPKDDSGGSGSSYTYYPSANVAPTRFTPVLFKRSVKAEEESSDVLLQPMMFGLIPAYHKVINRVAFDIKKGEGMRIEDKIDNNMRFDLLDRVKQSRMA